LRLRRERCFLSAAPRVGVVQSQSSTRRRIQMAGVTPTAITPTSLSLFQQPTQFNPGQDPSKLFG
jgi:hypothetical protein